MLGARSAAWTARRKLKGFEKFVTAANRAIGQAVGWLALLMVLVTCFVVVMRYFFDAGWIWVQESVTWMHAALFMLGAAYTLGCDEHVRVDVFYRGMSPRSRSIVDIGGVVFFLWPLCAYLGVTGFDYAAVSWSIEEASRESGGLPYPFVPLMKTLLPVTALLLALQGLALVLANLTGFGRAR